MAKNQVAGKWDKNVVQGEIFGSTVGILGLGSIGREIARKASAFGMHVIGIKGTPENVDYVDKVYDESGITEVFKESEYIINLLPYTSKTDKMIDKSFFSLMKDTACFINIGRGGTVNEDDLI
jgi:phosphoglycerate dehydrogenase-like enzyme